MLQALIYGVALLFACGVIERGRYYSMSTPFRAQTEAFLRGELALSHNLGDLETDLCWSQGGVHQVWGLGIPLWRLPFEFIAKVLGYSAFPDRFALAFFMSLVAYIVLRTWLPTLASAALNVTSVSPSNRNGKELLLAFGTVALSLFFAPIISLLLSRMLVYEEVIVYVYLYGVGLLCGIVSLARKPRWLHCFKLCLLAGLGGLFRPTLLSYGAATLFVSFLIMIGHKQKSNKLILRGNGLLSRRLIAGLFLFMFGVGILLLTNYSRFGAYFEFGHKLNFQQGNLLPSLYSTRFDYPFAHVPLTSSIREMFGALFQVANLNGFDYYRLNFFEGQAPIFRWREFLFSTYNRSYALGVSLGCFAGVWAWWKCTCSGARTAKNVGSCQREECFVIVLMILWAALAIGALGIFYRNTPAISSRYMLDFAPAFVATLIGFWRLAIDEIYQEDPISKLLISLFCSILIAWQGLDIFSRLKNGVGGHSMSAKELEHLHSNSRHPALRVPLAGAYELGNPNSFCGIPFNGEGWDVTTGRTKMAVVLFVNDPQFLILDVASAASANASTSDFDFIQTKIGLELLERQQITRGHGTVRIFFRGPRQLRYRSGIQPVFLAMSRPNALSNSDSKFCLLRVVWLR
jgi:hypothetical protein